MPPVFSKPQYTETGGLRRKYRKSRVYSYDRKIRRPARITRAPRMLKSAPVGKSISFPAQNVVQMRYCTVVTLFDSMVGGVLDLHAFRANGIYDPDVTGTGHQPIGRDQWLGTFYNHYKVISSRISVECTNTNVLAGTEVPAVVGLYLSDDLTTPTAWTTLKESGRGSARLQCPANTESTRLSCKFNQKFFSGQGVNQSQLGAAAGADPTEQAYYILWAQAADQTSTFSSRTFMVTIDYMVQLSEPRDLEAS